MNTVENKNLYKNAKGETKYYATYQSAWNACIRLNEKETNGVWYFEADLVGWYLELKKE